MKTKRGDDISFVVTKGEFTISAEVMKRALEYGDDFEVRRAYAIHMPEGAKVFRRDQTKSGAVDIHWRHIEIVVGATRD